MRLGLKNISQEDKLKLSADILLGQDTGFLNGVDLSTPEGKQRYISAVISGKNPFVKEDEQPSLVNIDLNIITPWSDIVRHADGRSVVSTKANFDDDSPFEDSLLNVAYRKKLAEIQMETALSKAEISERLLGDYTNNTQAQKSILSAVKFFHRISSNIFTECDNCGYENHPMWTLCQQCGYSNDGVPVKSDKTRTAT